MAVVEACQLQLGHQPLAPARRAAISVARLRLLSGKALRLRGRIARSCLGVIEIIHSYRVPLVLVESDLGSEYALTFVI